MLEAPRYRGRAVLLVLLALVVLAAAAAYALLREDFHAPGPAAAAVQLRDYGRIDFRVRTSDGAVFVLEANPNPDITFDSGFVRAAQASGRTHASVIREIVERASERAARP